MISNEEMTQLRDHYDKSMVLAEKWGLHPFPIDYHVVPADKMYEIASYGIPGHFSHWTYGRDFWKQKTYYDRGISKIYELIINSDPAQAFLLETNSVLENSLVISHTIGHSHVMRVNAHFAHTNRNMINSVISLANRVREYEFEHGRYVVESFIDDVLTIREHVNPYQRTKKKTPDYETAYNEHEYIDLFPEDSAEIELNLEIDKLAKKLKQFPEPERDLLQFIAERGDLEDWQRDIIQGIREESLYFLPQRQTQILNEGAASYIHHKMMHELDPEVDPGGIEFAQLHSAVLSGRPGNLNPYWLGFNILKRIEELHGWEFLLEIIALESDESLLRNWIDEKICEDLDLFAFAFMEEERQWEVTNTDWEEVRDILAKSKTTMGMPYIVIEGVDEGLNLKHIFDGRELKRSYTEETLKAVERLWGNTVWLTTQFSDKEVVFSSKGGTITARE